ncbi:uncharacterized protein LOC129313448 isoform X3 [Prosopis cineraria]|uniref:uncharacterized protein LOC129313448 isoform X3 n=1 Tax=Prosopis cineraria TaxID=364024 RepID=UPI00240EE2A3|nr:uncharacterized protein LOC129313448 isoform X3 [Prosopis cineraria]
MLLDIIYEDERGQITDMIHSSTWDVHPAAGNTSATLVNGILYHYNNPNVEISDKESFSEKGLVKCYNHIPACMEHQSASGLCIGRTMALVDCLLWQRHTITEILAKGGCALLEWKLETGRTHQVAASPLGEQLHFSCQPPANFDEILSQLRTIGYERLSFLQP